MKPTTAAITKSAITVPNHRSLGKMFFYSAVCLTALAVIVGAIYHASPAMLAGYHHGAEYLNPGWAHQENLIRVFIDFTLMIWLVMSGLFFGGWLLRRSIRKLAGKSWSLSKQSSNSKDKQTRFFPPVMRYLQVSCYCLVVILLFVILQYPVQFIYQ